jgi:serine/threonine protein kinase
MAGGVVRPGSIAPEETPSGSVTVPEGLEKVGRYQLIELLGVGGMAEVFKARCSGPGGFERTVVVKRILPAHCEDPEFVRMFVAEAKILGMVHHPNVVQVYDFGEADGALFLVLEYVDGPSMLRLMYALRAANRLVPPVIAAHFGYEVCRALEYVHNMNGSDGEPLNVVHRDVTPSNIVLTSSGALKLLDFGVAKFSASDTRSQHGTVKGKPAYLAPEMLEGQTVDRRSDLFSLGVVMHELLTLSALFGSDNDLVTLRKVMQMEIPPPSQLRGDLLPAVDAIVMKSLERDPSRRYQSAAEMGRDLSDVVVGARLHVDEVETFVRDAQTQLSQPRGPNGTPIAVWGSASTEIGARGAADRPPEEGAGTKRDFRLRFRMSRLGRLLFGDNSR